MRSMRLKSILFYKFKFCTIFFKKISIKVLTTANFCFRHQFPILFLSLCRSGFHFAKCNWGAFRHLSKAENRFQNTSSRFYSANLSATTIHWEILLNIIHSTGDRFFIGAYCSTTKGKVRIPVDWPAYLSSTRYTSYIAWIEIPTG